jgi:hypothetical protein
MRVLAAFLVTLLATSALAQDKPFTVGVIEFFGYSRLNLSQIKAALPVHEGERLAITDFPAAREKLRESVKREAGRDVTDVKFVCCDSQGSLMIFVGLAGITSQSFQYNHPPKGAARLPRSILDLYERAMELTLESVQKQPGEDRSKGYALSAYAPLRETQLAIRQFAIHNEPLIRSALRLSAEPRERQAAAYALGYSHQTKAQIAALVQASRDPDGAVRNDAVRALGVLASSGDRVAARIPGQTFARMLNSGVWEDRNKAGFLLDVLSRRRNPGLLRLMRSEALESLMEMARWRSSSHASSARVILGRIAGIEEKRLQQLVASGNVEEIISAARTQGAQ